MSTRVQTIASPSEGTGTENQAPHNPWHSMTSRYRHLYQKSGRRSGSMSQTPAPIATTTSRRAAPTWWKIRFFQGMLNDIKRRAPYYASDWTDAWDYRVVPATIYMYFAKYESCNGFTSINLLLITSFPSTCPLLRPYAPSSPANLLFRTLVPPFEMILQQISLFASTYLPVLNHETTYKALDWRPGHLPTLTVSSPRWHSRWTCSPRPT